MAERKQWPRYICLQEMAGQIGYKGPKPSLASLVRNHFGIVKSESNDDSFDANCVAQLWLHWTRAGSNLEALKKPATDRVVPPQLATGQLLVTARPE